MLTGFMLTITLTSSRKLKSSDEVYVKSRESQKLKSKIKSQDIVQQTTKTIVHFVVQA